MRLWALAFVVLATLSLSSAGAADGFVIDGREAEGKVYDATGDEVRVLDAEELADHGPLVAISLQSAEGGEVSLWQFHQGEKGFTVGLAKPGTPYDPSPADGVMRITNLAETTAQHRESPELESMLPLGKRYVIENIELVIYAPWCSSFRCYLLGNKSTPKQPVLAWIQGSLSDPDPATIPVL